MSLSCWNMGTGSLADWAFRSAEHGVKPQQTLVHHEGKQSTAGRGDIYPEKTEMQSRP